MQILRRVAITARYDSGFNARLPPYGFFLDASRHPELLIPDDWVEAWIEGQARQRDESGRELVAWAPFTYGGGQGPSRLRLSMVDFPRAGFYNVFRGGNRSDQLRHAEEELTFDLWVAAKRNSDPPQDPRSYHGLARANFKFCFTLDISGHNPIWAGGNTPSPSTLAVPPSRFTYHFGQSLRPAYIWGNSCHLKPAFLQAARQAVYPASAARNGSSGRHRGRQLRDDAESHGSRRESAGQAVKRNFLLGSIRNFSLGRDTAVWPKRDRYATLIHLGFGSLSSVG